MSFDQFRIVLGALLLGVVLGGLAVSFGLTNVLITPPEEGPEWIAKLIVHRHADPISTSQPAESVIQK